MDMKEHILAALLEKFVEWKDLLASLDEGQYTVPLEPSHWSLKDNLIHLYAWQLRTKARVEAALYDRLPEFPVWPEEPGEDVENINHWIFEANRELSWPDVYTKWTGLYEEILEGASKISEKDLLDSDRYAWLEGYSLADFLLGTYDHHREHLESLLGWLETHK